MSIGQRLYTMCTVGSLIEFTTHCRGVWQIQLLGVANSIIRCACNMYVCTDNATSVDTEELMAELELMKNMEPHENILNLLGHCTTPGNVELVHVHASTHIGPYIAEPLLTNPPSSG